jgi:hypothetical protein
LVAQPVQGAHVNGINIGPLLAVDLDVHEQLVHQAGGSRILEAFVGHDVAPVAGSIANGQEDWPAGAFCFGEGLGSPRPPMHRVVLVLEEIGARLSGETIFTHGTLRRDGMVHTLAYE